MKRMACAAAAQALVLAAGLAWADELAGSFRYNAVTVKPMDAIAYREDVEGRTVTVAVFTDFRLDRQAVLDAIVPWTGIMQQVSERQGNVVVLRLLSPTQCGAYAFLSATSQSIGLSDNYPARLAVKGERVAGDCGTAAPVKSPFDDTYEFKLSYDLPITAIPRASALAAGGGEAGAAFQELLKAIRARDARTAALHVPPEEAPTPPTPQFVEGLALNYPKQAAVTNGLRKGDRARLEITGTDNEDKKIRGTFDLRKVQGSWRVTGMSMFFAE